MPKKAILLVGIPAIAILGILLTDTAAHADSSCTFTVAGDVWSLDGDCMMDETIVVPDGVTLDGRGFTILAVDPAGDHFRGGVISNGGDEAHVTTSGSSSSVTTAATTTTRSSRPESITRTRRSTSASATSARATA